MQQAANGYEGEHDWMRRISADKKISHPIPKNDWICWFQFSSTLIIESLHILS